MTSQDKDSWVKRRWPLRKIRFFYTPRLHILKPPEYVWIATLVIVTVLLFGGGVYDFVERNIPTIVPGQGQQQWSFFIKYNLAGQTLSESVYSMIFYIIGIAGFYIMFRSTRQAYQRRQAWISLLIGIAMVLIAFIGCEVLLALKMSG